MGKGDVMMKYFVNGVNRSGEKFSAEFGSERSARIMAQIFLELKYSDIVVELRK